MQYNALFSHFQYYRGQQEKSSVYHNFQFAFIFVTAVHASFNSLFIYFYNDNDQEMFTSGAKIGMLKLLNVSLYRNGLR